MEISGVRCYNFHCLSCSSIYFLFFFHMTFITGNGFFKEKVICSLITKYVGRAGYLDNEGVNCGCLFGKDYNRTFFLIYRKRNIFCAVTENCNLIEFIRNRNISTNFGCFKLKCVTWVLTKYDKSIININTAVFFSKID